MAGAEVVGSILLVAAIVTVVALGAATYANAPAPAATDPIVEATGAAVPSGEVLVLTRAGGDPVDLGSLRVLVALDGEPWIDSPAGPAGVSWGLGEDIRIALPESIPEGKSVEVTIVAGRGEGHSRILTTFPITTERASAAEPIPGPTVVPLVGGESGTLAIRPTQNFLAEVIVDHPDGRKLILDVIAQLPTLAAPLVLRDDGSGGDAIAGDGAYSGFFTIQVNAPPGRYPLLMTATDIEGGSTTAVAWIDVLEPERPSGDVDLTTPPEPTPEGSPEAPPPPPPQSAPPPPPVTPRFTILPTGGVTPLCPGPLSLRIVGSEITWGAGGPPIPVRVSFTQNGGSSLLPLFGGLPIRAGQEVTFPLLPAGAVIGVRGNADYGSWHQSYLSFASDPHVQVLKDDDPVPRVPAFANQQGIEQYLAPYVEGNKMSLAANQVIVLYEFVPNLSSPAADYQDLVILFNFPSSTC